MIDLETVTLDNGLKIYLYQDKRKHSVFFQITTFCGGLTKHFKFDNKEYNLHDGIAHILEHYVVECNPKGNFLDKLGAKQMNTNASTAKETTSFYFETVENIEYGIDTMLEGLYNITFDKDKLEKLKKPIVQEIRGKLDNKFYHLAINKHKTLFHNLDYSNTGGTPEEVTKTTIDDLEVLYKAFYQPKNQFILIAGNFNKTKILKQIKDFYKNKKFDTSTELIKIDEPKTVNKKEDVIYFPTPMEYVDVAFKIDVEKFSTIEKYDLDFLLNSFFNASFGITSKLYEKLVLNNIIIDSIQTGIYNIDHFVIINVGSYTTNPEVFKQEVLKEIESLNSFSEERFELDKKSAIIRLIVRDESIFKTIRPLLNNIIIYNYPFLDKIEDIKRLTFNDLVKTIKNLDFSNYSITTIKNSEE